MAVLNRRRWDNEDQFLRIGGPNYDLEQRGGGPRVASYYRNEQGVPDFTRATETRPRFKLIQEDGGVRPLSELRPGEFSMDVTERMSPTVGALLTGRRSASAERGNASAGSGQALIKWPAAPQPPAQPAAAEPGRALMRFHEAELPAAGGSGVTPSLVRAQYGLAPSETGKLMRFMQVELEREAWQRALDAKLAAAQPQVLATGSGGEVVVQPGESPVVVPRKPEAGTVDAGDVQFITWPGSSPTLVPKPPQVLATGSGGEVVVQPGESPVVVPRKPQEPTVVASPGSTVFQGGRTVGNVPAAPPGGLGDLSAEELLRLRKTVQPFGSDADQAAFYKLAGLPEPPKDEAKAQYLKRIDEELAGRPDFADVPVLTPEQARSAAPGTRFRTTDGRMMVRHASPSEAEPGGSLIAARDRAKAAGQRTFEYGGKVYRIQQE